LKSNDLRAEFGAHLVHFEGTEEITTGQYRQAARKPAVAFDKRDGSVYYFAKDNLEYPRLAKEFKEGWGLSDEQPHRASPKRVLAPADFQATSWISRFGAIFKTGRKFLY
jgi:hypothetical protein